MAQNVCSEFQLGGISVKARTRGKKPSCDGFCGALPACAPLAVPYIPVQGANPPRYEADQGLVRGTMFPGLELPFFGLINEHPLSDTPLHRIQALSFAVHELSLYLDTHREDTEALELYRSYQSLLQEMTKAYEQQIGPLTHAAPGEGAYAWLDDPWPWEYGANREE